VRVQRVKAIVEKNEDAVGVSIHGNAALNPGQGRGWEVWTALEDKSLLKKVKSDRLATIAYATARALLPFKMRSDMTDGDPDKEGHMYILKNSPCPFILTENGFYDYEPDCRFMLSNNGKDLIAKMHAYAIETYLNIK
jgi:N-acetylmuramoyl-L-alanine amidase